MSMSTLLAALAVAGALVACGGSSTGSGDTPVTYTTWSSLPS